MRRIIIATALFCGSGLVAGCHGPEDGPEAPEAPAAPQDDVLVIDHYMVPCYGAGPELCLREATSEKSGENLLFHGAIEGFSYEWGHRYTLRVAISEVEEPMADGSSMRYELVEVMSDEVVNEDFSLVLAPEFIIGDPVSGGFGLLDARTVWCAAPAVCETIAAIVDAGELVEVEIAHASEPSAPMIAESAREAE